MDSPIQRYSGLWPALRLSKNSGFLAFISSAHLLLFSKMRSWDCWRYLRTSLGLLSSGAAILKYERGRDLEQ
jgi:hypothetical protein